MPKPTEPVQIQRYVDPRALVALARQAGRDSRAAAAAEREVDRADA